ncbi:MAG: 3-hydroxyacyl-CoA dehydrogenase NAD-binding domain-containing protein [Burkholderiales bacterium]
MPVSFVRERDVAVISVNNPPVNVLSQPVRAGLQAALRQAADDAAVTAIVILCEGRTFIAGADVNEFDQPPQPPHLPQITEALENSIKPVVAAIHGTALGGGYEIALACHYRLATSSAKIGLPEVKLGLMPGAGGTQRLPRLVGVGQALQLICEGNPISAPQALAWGALDEITEGDLQAAALTVARRLAAAGKSLRRTGALELRFDNPELFSQAAEAVARKQRGLIAPRYCIEAVRAATTLPLDAGLKRERELFLELRAAPQAAALRHAFLGERVVAKIPGLPADTRAVKQAAVIGAGTMGAGIAMCFANAGIAVTLLEAQAEALEHGMSTIRQNYTASAARGGLTEKEMEQRLSSIHPTLSYEDLRSADLIIEAVFEDLQVKKQVFEKLDAAAKPGAILATNTSYLDVAAIAEFTRRPQDVVGMHFFSPAQVMKLLENVRAPKTAPDVLATVMKLGKTLGKVAVLVGGAHGFVGNRMLAQRTREAFFLLEEGALPQQVDKVLHSFGFPMGPFAVGDLAGLDIGWRARQARAHLRKPGVRDCNLLDKVCALGRFGQKTHAGWYRYEAGSRAPLPDPVIEELIIKHSREAGVERRSISSEEILERCLYAMINEAAKILAEGVAARPLDIDMVWLHGYGFPAYRGGPLFYADSVGLEKIYQDIIKLRARFGPDFWTPAPLLEQMARDGQGFYPHRASTPYTLLSEKK